MRVWSILYSEIVLHSKGMANYFVFDSEQRLHCSTNTTKYVVEIVRRCSIKLTILSIIFLAIFSCFSITLEETVHWEKSRNASNKVPTMALWINTIFFRNQSTQVEIARAQRLLHEKVFVDETKLFTVKPKNSSFHSKSKGEKKMVTSHWCIKVEYCLDKVLGFCYK